MPGSPLAQSERQLVLRRRLDSRMTDMRDRARRAAAERQAERAADEELQRTAAENLTLVKATASERVFYGVMLAALPTVYIIDVMLLGPVAEFLASEGFAENSLIVRLAPFVVPAMIIGLETVVGAFRMAAYREYLAGDAGVGSYKTLTVLATLLALFIPAAGVALYLREDTAVPETAVGAAVLFLPIALPIVLSLACHLCILLGSRRMHEAKTWWTVTRKCSQLRAGIERRRQTFARESTAAADLLPLYLQDLDEYNGAFQPPLAAGPFDQSTRAIVNEVYGYEAIRTAATPPEAGRAASPVAAPKTPTGSSTAGAQGDRPDADAPDWEALCALQQRDDESEVRA
jgi:hypothetical protein